MNKGKLYKHCFSSSGIYLGCKEVNPFLEKVKKIGLIAAVSIITATIFISLCASRGIGFNHHYNDNATSELHIIASR